MKKKIIIAILVVTLVSPSLSYGWGFLRYAFDAVSNQLGLDRGPIPKIPQRPQPPPGTIDAQPLGKHADPHRIYIQADGF